jgi:hypothetical protein
MYADSIDLKKAEMKDEVTLLDNDRKEYLKPVFTGEILRDLMICIKYSIMLEKLERISFFFGKDEINHKFSGF